LGPLQESGDRLDIESANRWLRAASLDQTTPLTANDPVLSALADASEGSFLRFARLAAAAIEDAADRGVSALDDASREAALAQALAE